MIDEKKLQQFLGKMIVDLGAAISVPRTIVITALPAVSASSASRGPPRGAGRSREGEGSA
jgi:hypothetical protein